MNIKIHPNSVVATVQITCRLPLLSVGDSPNWPEELTSDEIRNQVIHMPLETIISLSHETSEFSVLSYEIEHGAEQKRT